MGFLDSSYLEPASLSVNAYGIPRPQQSTWMLQSIGSLPSSAVLTTHWAPISKVITAWCLNQWLTILPRLHKPFCSPIVPETVNFCFLITLPIQYILNILLKQQISNASVFVSFTFLYCLGFYNTMKHNLKHFFLVRNPVFDNNKFDSPLGLLSNTDSFELTFWSLPVSYTHLDVYKRQISSRPIGESNLLLSNTGLGTRKKCFKLCFIVL